MLKLSKVDILNTTFKIINKQGLDNVSISKIADELNCTKSAIYYHVNSKEDILNSLFVKIVDDLHDQFILEGDLAKLIERYYLSFVKNIEKTIFIKHNCEASFVNKTSKDHLKKLNQNFIDKCNILIATDYTLENIELNIFIALLNGPIFYLAMEKYYLKKQLKTKDVQDLAKLTYESLRKGEM